MTKLLNSAKNYFKNNSKYIWSETFHTVYLYCQSESVRIYFDNHSYGDVIRKNFDIEGYWLNEEGVEKKIIEEVNEWQQQREKELDALHQWNIKCQIDTYFQWRTFYADQLITELNK